MDDTSRCSGCRAGSASTRPTSSGGSTSCRGSTTRTSIRARRRTSRREASRRRRGSTRRTGRCAIRSRGSSTWCGSRRGATRREGAAVKPKAPPELLAEMFEIQESAAGGAGGRARRRPSRATLAGQRDRLMARIPGRGSAPARAAERRRGIAPARTSGPGVLAAFKEALATRAYLRTVIDDLDRRHSGDRDEEPHVSHRRH